MKDFINDVWGMALLLSLIKSFFHAQLYLFKHENKMKEIFLCMIDGFDYKINFS
jgi:hypothetical protein